MGRRTQCCSPLGLNRGPWNAREDSLLIRYVHAHGEGHWRSLAKKAGLLRSGKSCRLRWINYLRPDIKRGNITPDEEDLIIRLHSLLGNRWSLIAGRLPGRTGNEIKNYWNSHLRKRLKLCVDAKKLPKKSNQSDSESDQEVARTKVDHPQPIKVSQLPITRDNSFDSGHMLTESLHWLESELEDGIGNVGGQSMLISDKDHGFDNNENNNHVTPAKEMMLDKIYEEYQQLLKASEDHLQLNSFVESLLV